MILHIAPSRAAGSVPAPPSKSMSHRLLICAGLSDGTSLIENLAPSEDILATMDCLRSLGADVRFEQGKAEITGCDPLKAPSGLLPCRESGSTLRFFLPLALLSGQEMLMKGSEKLLSRPLWPYEELCRDQGLFYEASADGLRLKGPLTAGSFVLPGDVSSQFATGLLFALPLLKEDSLIRFSSLLESKPYLDMTINALQSFGVHAERRENALLIPGGQRFRPQKLAAEGDWSNGAALLALGADVTGLREDSLQGDKICREYFRALEEGCPSLDLRQCPDLAPVLFAYAALHHGGRFTGTGRLQHKESDRGRAMQEELKKFGVSAVIEEDSICIGCGIAPPSEPLESHNDHRIVMALSLLCTRTGGSIRGAEAVNKSFPEYIDVLQQLGIRLERNES